MHCMFIVHYIPRQYQLDFHSLTRIPFHLPRSSIDFLEMACFIHNHISYWNLMQMSFSIPWQMFLFCRCQKSGHRNNSRLSAFIMALQFTNKIPIVVNGLIRFGGRNGSSLLHRTEMPTLQLAKRNASIHTSNRFVRMLKAEHITPLGWALLVRIIYFYPYESNL